MNANLTSLRDIVSAMQQGEYIVDVSPLTENGVEVGYKITFSEHGTINIYHGKDGLDSGTVPEIGVKQDVDGVYYWTINGEWVLDEKGNKLPVSSSAGADSLTPELKIENDKWYVSYDAGKTWVELGDAVASGSGGCLFKDVQLTEGILTITMADGTVLVLPIGEKFRIIFGEFDPETLKYGTELIVPYTIEGAQGEVSVFALNKSVWFDVDLVEETANSGKLIIYQKDYSIEEYSDKIALFAVAEDGTTISKVISVVSNVLYPVSGNYGESFSIGAEGGQIAFTVATNREVEVETNADWITCVSTKAVEVKTLLFDVQSNEGKNRRATVEISSGDITLVFVVNQSSGDAPEVVEPITEGVIWENDGTIGAATWSDSPYLFSIEGGDPQGKCVAEIPAAVWAGMKIAPLCVNISPTAENDYWLIHFTDGLWSANMTSANDINPETAGVVDNGNGTYTFKIDLTSDPDLLAAIDTNHLLFVGQYFIINKIYFGEPENPGQGGEELAKSDWYIVGSFTGEGWGWDPAAGLPLYVLDENYFVYYGLELAEGAQWKFLQGGAWGGAEVGADKTSVEPNTIQAKGGYNILVNTPGKYDIYLSADATTYYVMSEGKTPAEATEPSAVEKTYTVTGTISGQNWWNNMAEEGLMAKEGDYYVAKNVPMLWESTLYGGADQIAFKICNTGSWNGAYGVAEAGAKSANSEIAVVVDGGDIEVVAPEGSYDVYFDEANAKVWVMEPGLKPGEKPVEPVTEGVIWKNDGSVGDASWSSIYRFSVEGGDSYNECRAEISAAVWAGMKIEPFYVNITPVPDVGQWQIRITDGWWSKNYSANDITPGYEGLTDNGDGTYTFQVDLASNPDLVAVIDAQHLLFTGSGFIINEIYFSMPDGGEEPETPEQPAETVIWENDGTFGEVTWGNTYSFALEGTNDGDASVDVPADLWQYFKSGPFHVVVLPVADWWQIRVLTGWWSAQWPAADNSGEGDVNVYWTDIVADNGDGTFTVTIDFTGHEILDSMDEQYLLFTGSGFQIQKIYSLQ